MFDKLSELESQRSRKILFETLRMHEHIDNVFEALMDYDSITARDEMDKLSEMLRLLKTDLKRDE